ncbi:ribose-phosphate pyrophosphokinase [Pseudothermotoga thermarum]|uniref:Ribose-phosphate pyrophosphokinase n=1 Tax=Pseudothermotoga thermarum DSM 5069 TaxID=688269 RepID=F7YYA0_9THEM|nr:ribose-phosphate pyrophosphokinase [Pseudothermotoga thermarum]AEH50921.1 ribose-phosphate pyrophosphokinase [Pseudothermotoga thermarum DSM 5069]
MPLLKNEFKLFAGNSNLPLAKKVAEYLGVRLGDCQVSRFSDGEINVRINETVRGHDIFLIQSTSPPVNENLMELLVMIDAFKRASASSIAVVIPYYGYARQDRKAKGRDPITAKLVANLITVAGATRVLTIDLHADQIQGFFDIPVDNLYSFPVFVEVIQKEFKEEKQDLVIVSPDVGAVRRASKFAEKLQVPLAILDKRRPADNMAEVVNVIGDVKGKIALMFDDIIDTGGTIVQGAEILKKSGARRILAFATHGVLSGKAVERIVQSEVEKVYITDTIHHENLPEKFQVVSVASLLGEAIIRIRRNLSVSILFR